MTESTKLRIRHRQVDSFGVPFVQLIFLSSTEIALRGLFEDAKGGYAWVTEEGMYTNMPPAKKIAPLFKYPAWRFPGELLPPVSPSPPVVHALNR